MNLKSKVCNIKHCNSYSVYLTISSVLKYLQMLKKLSDDFLHI